MPWCEACQAWRPTEALDAEGGCPRCQDVIATPPVAGAPWHFKLLVAAVVAYLGWRGLQGVSWVVHHL